MEAMGVSDFEEIRRRGVIVGHDNRFLGQDFAFEVIGLLHGKGIRTWYAGEAPTPEFSAGIEMLHAACSINLTPSHNPANYSGFKFNPSDGGPAGSEITKKIEKIANRMMTSSPVLSSVKPGHVETMDLDDLYLQFINKKKTIDMDRIREFIDRGSCLVCIDHMHGATRKCIKKILGKHQNIVSLRTEDDYLFGGLAPEPSEKNMQEIEKVLKESSAKFRLGVIIDPDGDRIRYADGDMQIPMNYFGAMAFHFLHRYKGISGIVVKSAGTSNLVNAIAEKMNIPVKETKVGFKNFRPFMLPTSQEKAIVAFEESDGISGYNHILEKDALFGLLLGIEMMAVTGKNLSEYLHDIMDEFGYYYPDRSGIAVDPGLVGEPLNKRLSRIQEHYREGTVLMSGTGQRSVNNVITLDGTKLVLDNGSWLMIRPSGTEPKVRFYIEARTEDDKKAVSELAERITREAIGT
jgi:phosphomannomutase